MIKYLFIYILFFVFGPFYSQCNTINDFNSGWYGVGGNWNVSSSGNSVNQTVNGPAVYFLNGRALMNTSISGVFRTDDNDDDQMGFVFGVEGVIGVGNYHYYLFRWDEGGNGNGMYIDEIDQTGTVNLFSAVGNYWTRSFDHSFVIDYSLNSFSVSIDGVLMHTENGANNPGEFGFYNRSQANVTYSNLIYTGSFDYVVVTDTVCFGNATEVELPVNLYNLPSVVWNMGDGTIINGVRTVSHVYSAPGVYPVSCEGDDLSGCFGSIVYDVVVLSNPKASFTQSNICLGETMEFNNNSTISSIDLFNKYSWNIDGVLASSKDTLFNFLLEGNYDVELEVETVFGCVDDTLINVIVSPNPVVGFTTVNTCVNDEALFNNTSMISNGSIVSYRWNFGDAPSATTVQSTVASPSYQYLVEGTYDVRLTTESDMGCLTTEVLTSVRYPRPVANFYASNECEYDSVDFQNSSSIDAPGIIASTIWNYGDGSPLSLLQEEKYKFNSSGTYSVNLLVKSTNGCLSSVNKTIEIYDVPISSFQSTMVCDNEGETEFVNQSLINNGAIVISNWDFGDGSNSNMPNPRHKYALPGVYTANLVSTSYNGCLDTLETLVTVKASPVASFFVDNTSGCSPLCLDFIDYSAPNSSSIVLQRWFFDDEELGGGANLSNCFFNESNYDDKQINMSYVVTNDLGCQDTMVLDSYLTVYHNPVSYFTINPSVTNMYEREVEMENQSIGADDYLWFLENKVASEDFEPTYEYPDTGRFDVLLISYTVNNCIDSSFQSLLIEPVENVYIPNAFTPDGDGINDYFSVTSFGIKNEGFLLNIFNRWGESVFETTDLFEGWNGLYQGKVCKSDVYVYKVTYSDLKNDINEIRGTVSLLR